MTEDREMGKTDFLKETGPAAGSGDLFSEEEMERQRLAAENEKLRAEIERIRALPLKERMYEKVHVSVRTMDIFIAVMVVLFIVVIVMGLIAR